MTKRNQHLKIMSQESLLQFENFDKNLLDKNEIFYLDLFLISFYSGGVSLKNLANLKKEDINGDQLNCKNFKYPLVNSVTLNKEAMQIIEKYKNQSYEGYIFPIFIPKHNLSTQKEDRVKHLMKKINATLHKVSEILNLKDEYPTFSTAKYTFIAKLFKEKKYPKEIYSFAGITALSVESYLIENETPIEKEVRMKETLEKMDEAF